MSTATMLKLGDKQYVILPREEYDRLNGLAKSVQLPPLPPPDADGNYPAVGYARVSIARDIIRERVSLGADAAGVGSPGRCPRGNPVPHRNREAHAVDPLRGQDRPGAQASGPHDATQREGHAGQRPVTMFVIAELDAPMATHKHKPIHPGEVLRLDFLEPMDISVYRLAKETGVSAQQLGRIIKGTRGVSGDLALRLARFFGTSAKVWIGLQAQYELDVAEDEAGSAIKKRVKPLRVAMS